VNLTVPSTAGRGLVNLMSELESRLGGSPPLPGLDADLSGVIPTGSSYVLALFDGLGAAQLDVPEASSLASSQRGIIHAPFPTTTTVALATVATGLAPAGHGVIGHLMWLPELEKVVNVLKWRTPEGADVDFDTASFLPAPNLWERLKSAGVEPITIQPGDFQASPLTRAVYRGCRFEPVYSIEESVAATVELAATPNRLIFTYFQQVDFAAHVWGQRSGDYLSALTSVDRAWSALCTRLAPEVTLVGTADHGHVDYREADKIPMRDEFDRLIAFGDPRSVYLRGGSEPIAAFAEQAGAAVLSIDDLRRLWGAERGTHPQLARRQPEAAVLAPRGKVLLPKGFDRRLIGYHGGLDPAELEIPLLVR
jgi:hypothetical protein